ncbi:MAG: ribonuclease P protein component [bacterium]|nr:ribonuclease P protein component [bacterium]
MAARSSSSAARRGGDVSPRDGRPYRSLRGRSDFQRVFRTGSRLRSGGVTVVATPGQPGAPRVGVVAGRRIGGAVARNRAKRRMREALARVRLRDGVDYIVIASEQVNGAGFGELVDWIDQAVSAGNEER